MYIYLSEEFLRRAVLGDSFLGGGLDHDDKIASGIKVVLKPEHLARELSRLLARVPLGWNQYLKPVSAVWHEVRVCLWLSEHISCMSNKILLVNDIYFM